MSGRALSSQGELGQTALVVDRHGRPVLDGALYVVDADVVAEDGARVGVGEFDGRAREADERRVRQGVAHVPGEAVDEVVLAAVRLVGDHHDIAAVGQLRVPITSFFRKELLDSGEHHAALLHREPRPKVGAARSLDRRLAQQVLTSGERPEELVIEVVPVGQHDHGWILHGRIPGDAPGVEGHREALASTLRVPDDADAPVAQPAARTATRLVASIVENLA